MPSTPRIVSLGPVWLQRREIGLRNPLGTVSNVYKQLYLGTAPSILWDDYECRNGGVFSLEFSPEGSLLVAACERRNVMVFDPLQLKPIYNIDNAHDDCVNCIRFIDCNTFATGSDDYTVALWDVRNLSQKVRSLQGHDNWVKSIEYCPSSQLLVTSGFDGSVLTWEMSNSSSDSSAHNVFSMNGLMRTRLTPDCSKMIICTTAGYLIVIHNLELETLKLDLDNFKPNMYRLMQLSQTILPGAAEFTHMFRGAGKRNRVEFICDFPEDDDAEVVSAVQTHPDGHSIVSRNVSNDEKSEWTCVHNIEERLSSDDSEGEEESEQVRWPAYLTAFSTQPSFVIRSHQNIGRRGGDNAELEDMQDLSVTPSDVWEAVVAIQDARLRRQRDQAARDLTALIFESENGATRQANPSAPPALRRSPRSASSVLNPGASSTVVSREIPSATATTTSTSSSAIATPPVCTFTIRRPVPTPVPDPPAVNRSTQVNEPGPSTSHGVTYIRSSGLTVSNDRIWSLRRFSRAVSPASSSSSSSTGPPPLPPRQPIVTNIPSASDDGNDNDPGEGTSRDASGESSPDRRRMRRPPLRQRRSKRLQLASNRRSRRLRTNYEMNETARLQNARRGTQIRKRFSRWRLLPREHNSDRVIFMNVFRETGPRGERGTSMHRHTIAALTVSSDENVQYLPGSTPKPTSPSATQDLAKVRVNKKIHQNIPRLTHYIEEPNVGRGYIKELCFSPDGRILCSPYGNGVRLLAFSQQVQDLRHCYPCPPPIPLHELSLHICHTDIVVSTKFSPVHQLLMFIRKTDACLWQMSVGFDYQTAKFDGSCFTCSASCFCKSKCTVM